MIYTRYGEQVNIHYNLGQHTPSGFVAPVTLLQVRSMETGKTFFAFAEFLRADEGWAEINRVASNAPTQELDPSALQGAFEDAE